MLGFLGVIGTQALYEFDCLTTFYKGDGVSQKTQTSVSDDTEPSPSSEFAKLAKELEEIKKRLASLEGAA